MTELQTIIERMGQIVPAEETLEKLISHVRNHATSPLDAPFSLGSLAEYNIPPEAIPTVMLVYEKRLREVEQYFTIREALWIARLFTVVDPPIDIGDWASIYATWEQVCWVLGETFFTRDLDVTIFQRRKGPYDQGLTDLGRKMYPYRNIPLPSLSLGRKRRNGNDS